MSALSSAALLWSENDSNLTTVMLPSFRNLPLDQDVFFKESAIGNQRSNAMVRTVQHDDVIDRLR